MKAITVSVLPATDTLPRRVKAKAEGVPAITRSVCEVEGRDSLSLDKVCEKLAHELCTKYGWGKRLAGGVLPDGRTHVFCFVEDSDIVKASRDALSNLVEDENADGEDIAIAAVYLLVALNTQDLGA